MMNEQIFDAVMLFYDERKKQTRLIEKELTNRISISR